MFLEPLILLLLIRYLRISLQTKTQLPQWDKVLLMGIALAIAVMVGGIFLNNSNALLIFTGHALVFALAYIIFYVEAFRPAKAIMYSVLPLIIISLLANLTELINKKFYNQWDDYFDIHIMANMMAISK